MREDEDVMETIEMLYEILKEKNVEVDDKAVLEDIARALVESSDESELNKLDIEELSDILVEMDSDYQKTPIEDARIRPEVREELKGEADYVAEFYSDDIDYFDLRTKDELREHLGDIIVDSVWGLEREFDDTEVYKALRQAFGTEMLATTLVTNKKTDELVEVELKKINTLNRHYLTIDEPKFQAISL